MPYSFKKEERLCHKKLINDIFLNGFSFNVYPFVVKWRTAELKTGYPAQILISVPARNMPKAVCRNKIRRLIREAYRKNKDLLYDFLKKHNKQCVFSVVYNGKEIVTYKEIESKIVLILQTLQKDYEKNLK